MAGRTPQPVCEAFWLGRTGYGEAWTLQRALAVRRSAGEIPDALLLLEHDPVYTTGRRDAARNLRLPVEMLGAPLVESDRGGDITFHGPGQLIAYPIISLRAAGLGVAGYVRALEQVVIQVLAEYGIRGGREAGLTGVWVDGAKVAAIGVRVSRPGGPDGAWVTSHGLALNVDVDLSWFERIVPCGIAGRDVTSMAALLSAGPALPDVAERLGRCFGKVFGRRIVGNGLLGPSQSDSRSGLHRVE